MAYALLKHALNQAFNPYEMNLLQTTPAITRQEVKDKLNEVDIYEKEDATERENLVRKIAYMVANPQFQLVKLEDDFASGNIQAKAEFMAMLLETQGEAFLDEVSDSVLKTFNYRELEATFEKYKTEFFSWDNLSYYLEDTWKNVDYVLQRIEQANYSAWDEIFKNFREDMMDNITFQEGFEALTQQNKDTWYFVSSDKTPAKISLHPKCLDWMEKDMDVFQKITKEVYISILSTARDLHRGKNFETYYLNHQLRDKAVEDKPLFEKIILELDKAYRAKFFDSPNRQKYIDTILSSKDLRQLMTHFPKDILENHDVIKNYLLRQAGESYLSFHDNFPFHVVAKDASLMEVFLNYILPNYDYIKNKSELWESWINNKDKLIEYAALSKDILPRHQNNDEPHNPFIKFWDCIPTAFRKDADVMKVFIRMRARLYNNLAQNMRDNPELFAVYVNGFIEQPDDYKANKVSMTAFINSSKEIQLKAIEKMPELISVEGFPQALLDEPAFIISRSKRNGDVVATTEVMSQILASSELLKDFILAHKKNFFLLPEELRRDVNLAKIWIEHVNDKNMYYSEIQSYKKDGSLPAMLFSSQDFCLNLIETGRVGGLETIHPNFWNDRNFVLKLLTKIDEEKIHESILDSAPEKMKAIKEFYKVKQGGYVAAFAPCLSKSQLEQNLQVNAAPIKRKKI